MGHRCLGVLGFFYLFFSIKFSHCRVKLQLTLNQCSHSGSSSLSSPRVLGGDALRSGSLHPHTGMFNRPIGVNKILFIAIMGSTLELHNIAVCIEHGRLDCCGGIFL